jgi:ABC-2 type transport system ATP-binding protein
MNYSINEKQILSNLQFTLQPGTFTALLGENGSGKSTLLDLLMGYRLPKQGEITVEGKAPHLDDLTLKANTIYLSEKMEVPVYWKIGDYLDFHRHFYPNYSTESEKFYMNEYKISRNTSIRSLSAGENKRAQIVAALASQPQLMMIDEITAVLDIVGRQRFMTHLSELKAKGATVLMATNILENIEHYTSHLLLLNRGKVSFFGPMNSFVKPQILFTEQVASILQAA